MAKSPTAPKGSKAAALTHAQKITHRSPAGRFKPPPFGRSPVQAEPQLPSPEDFMRDTYGVPFSFDPDDDLGG